MSRHYSGELSTSFWKRVKRLERDANRETYSLGCALQELEHRTLGALEEGERELRELKRKKVRR